MKQTPIIILISLFAALSSCDSGADFGKASTDEFLLPSNLAVPVGSIHLQIADFLHYFNSDSLFAIDTTGNDLKIMFEHSNEFYFSQQSFRIENIDALALDVDIPTLNIQGFTSLTDSFVINLDLAGSEISNYVETIDSIVLNKLVLGFDYQASAGLNGLKLGIQFSKGSAYYVDENGHHSPADTVEMKYISLGTSAPEIAFENIIIKPMLYLKNTRVIGCNATIAYFAAMYSYPQAITKIVISI
jgi:hypothetical protein